MAEAVREPRSSGLSLPNAGITSVRHHARLIDAFKSHLRKVDQKKCGIKKEIILLIKVTQLFFFGYAVEVLETPRISYYMVLVQESVCKNMKV